MVLGCEGTRKNFFLAVAESPVELENIIVYLSSKRL